MDYIKLCSLDESLKDPLEFQHPACFYCNGFYGPCFGEPVCATCHDFMYAEDFEQFHSIASSSGLYQPEKDDGDSGNDEPSEEAAPGGSRNNSRPERVPAVEMAVDVVEPRPEPQAGASRSPENENSMGDDEPMNVDGFHFSVDLDKERFPGPSKWPLRPHEQMENRLALLTTPRLHETAIQPKEDMSQKIPPEIWAAIFRKLDDVSLLMASKVNSKWKAIVLDQHANTKWEEFVKLRWPLFHPIYSVADWYSVYSDFIDSVPCKLCFINLLVDLPGEIWNGDPLGPGRCLRSVRLHKELKWLRMDHPEGIEAIPLDNLNYNWLARINGPPQSPYQGGVFYMNLKVPHDYPLKPPIVRFLTKLFHPNVSRHGDIGIDCIQHNWTLALTIPQILLSVQSLLTDPYLETNMEPSISELYKKDRPRFDKMAKVWTWKYAMHDVLLH